MAGKLYNIKKRWYTKLALNVYNIENNVIQIGRKMYNIKKDFVQNWQESYIASKNDVIQNWQKTVSHRNQCYTKLALHVYKIENKVI